MTVWIAQCLCPDRHCILATAGEADSHPAAVRGIQTPLAKGVAKMIASGPMNPWCALCGAPRDNWRFELRPTKFATMEDAMPHLERIEAENLATNRLWGDLHKTARPN